MRHLKARGEDCPKLLTLRPRQPAPSEGKPSELPSGLLEGDGGLSATSSPVKGVRSRAGVSGGFAVCGCSGFQQRASGRKALLLSGVSCWSGTRAGRGSVCGIFG